MEYHPNADSTQFPFRQRPATFRNIRSRWNVNSISTTPPPQPQPRRESSSRDCSSDNAGSKRGRESPSTDSTDNTQQPPAPRRSKKKSKSNKSPQPQPKQIKGTPGNKGNYHNRYRKRWGTESTELKPYYPMNSYPCDFTAARYQMGEDKYVGAWFAYNILLMGDGHMASLVRFLGKDKKYKKYLDNDMYRRDLLLEDLVAYLGEFDKEEGFPKRVMLSIGNYDVRRGTGFQEFKNLLSQLTTTLQNLGVTEIILVPLLPLPPRSNYLHTHENITRALDTNWEAEFNITMTNIANLFEDMHTGHAYYDESGPYYDIDDYQEIANRIHERFIPPLQPRPSVLRAAQAAAQAAENATNQEQNAQVAGAERMREEEPASTSTNDATNTTAGNSSITTTPTHIFSSQQVGNAIITVVKSIKTNEEEKKREEFIKNRQSQQQKEAEIEREENQRLQQHTADIEAFVDSVNKGDVNDIYLQTEVFDQLCKKNMAKNPRPTCSTPQPSPTIPDVSNLSVNSPGKASSEQPKQQTQDASDTSQTDENISEPSTASTWLESINEGDEFEEAASHVLDLIENPPETPHVDIDENKKPDDDAEKQKSLD
ncbi:uncharacterized protein LOC135835539 [Planococcus citri]|uniref:uncharacterized protein LOC135835539 n=1 Tax=Planococcus citri TaxID=170843 RepID=UPI0031F76BC7